MLKTHKSFKNIIIIFSLILLGVGVVLTLYQLQQQQLLKQFASQTTQSATAACSTENNTGTIEVSFTNTDPEKDIDVVAKDLQTGKTVDLGTITHSASKQGTIVTDKASLDAGSVVFTFSWTDGTVGTETSTAPYTAVGPCNQTPTPIPACIQNQAFCRWDILDGAVSYDVVIKEVDSNKLIKSETLPQSASQSAFIMEPDKTYTCTVTPKNACGIGSDANATQKSCVLPSPTPTPTATPTNTPTPTPEATLTPTPTPTPQPTNTPIPTPTTPPVPTSPPNPTTPFSPSQPPPPGVTNPPTFIAAQQTAQPPIPVSGNNNQGVIFAATSITLSLIGLLLFFAL